MSTVVKEEEVPGLSGADEIGDGTTDVGAGGLRIRVIGVDEHGDVLLGEAEAIDEASVHAFDVVDAALELSLGAGIVTADEQRLLCHVFRRVSFLSARQQRSTSVSPANQIWGVRICVYR